jgi:CubicO group peptidase (beta-lactamase class C family)
VRIRARCGARGIDVPVRNRASTFALPPIEQFTPELDRLAADAMADWKVPAAALAVVQDGKVALAKAYGQRDVEANLPVTTAAQFLICSINDWPSPVISCQFET